MSSFPTLIENMIEDLLNNEEIGVDLQTSERKKKRVS